MYIKNIGKLRRFIISTIDDCKNALMKTDNDVEKAFILLKQYKMEPIVQKTGVSIEEAFMMYQQCNGDIEKAIERILYISKAPLSKETEYHPDMYKRSKDSVRVINSIFKYLTREIDTNEYDTFMALLSGLKNNWTLFDYYGNKFIKILMELLIKNNDLVGSEEYKRTLSNSDEFDKEALIQKNEMDRILLIETIVNAIDEDEYGNSEKKCGVGNYNINKLFDDYIKLCNHNTYESIEACLKNFMFHGISPTTIFTKLAENSDHKEQTVAILARMHIDNWGEIPDRFSDLLIEVKKASKLLKRSHIISQFILVVHPLCGANCNNSAISFSYFSYDGACYDWCWNSLGRTDKLVEDKILSIREAKTFEKLGSLLKCEENLNSSKIRELYDEFFQHKDPFDVIYTLPE